MTPVCGTFRSKSCNFRMAIAQHPKKHESPELIRNPRASIGHTSFSNDYEGTVMLEGV